MITLHIIDTHVAQHDQRRFGFDKLGNRAYAEVLTQTTEVVHQNLIGAGFENIAHESTVNFHEIEGQLAQIVERVVTAAEIIERK